ncbi:MAG: DUF2293 domain-containing protein [Bryobacteraceae bacterium]
MQPATKPSLEMRVVRAAEAALADHNYVSAIDILTGIGFLAIPHQLAWRKGQTNSLEESIQAKPTKVVSALDLFHRWAQSKGLQPSEASYVCQDRNGVRNLQFTRSGDPVLEAAYRTHYISPALSERKRQSLQERLSKPAPPVVFLIVKDSECSECGVELPRDSFLSMDGGQPLCLSCARLNDLEYVPSGDAALTRRATKHSQRSAVVVRFSKSRGRYERQGILAEPAAIEKAEHECIGDAADRAAARAKAILTRERQDEEFVQRMLAQLSRLFPGCPPKEAQAIARHTATRGSGRVGRSAAGRNLEPRALTAAVIAAIRHTHTAYDEMLSKGIERTAARLLVAAQIGAILEAWK